MMIAVAAQVSLMSQRPLDVRLVSSVVQWPIKGRFAIERVAERWELWVRSITTVREPSRIASTLAV
jgi:hypothetical protein